MHPGLIPRQSAEYWLPGRAPITTLFPDGFRFTASPTLIGLHYLLEMKSPPLPPPEDARVCTATGVLVIFTDHIKPDGSPSISYPISMPCERYHEAVDRIDYLTEFGKFRRNCMDGTPATFERIRGAEISYFDDGNTCAASDPSMAISGLLQPLLREYGPKDVIPSRPDWYPDDNAAFPPAIQRLYDLDKARQGADHNQTVQ